MKNINSQSPENLSDLVSVLVERKDEIPGLSSEDLCSGDNEGGCSSCCD